MPRGHGPLQKHTVTSERARRLLENQNYQCAICGKPINGGHYFDFTTMLLCGKCALQ